MSKLLTGDALADQVTALTGSTLSPRLANCILAELVTLAELREQLAATHAHNRDPQT